MTSQEALENIKKFTIIFDNRRGPDQTITPIPEYFAREISIIQKDLEVFEILKRIGWLVYNNGDKNDFNWYIDINKTMQITEEEAEKLKGWLENDK